MNDEHYMQVALTEARAAGAAGEVPVGAVIVKDDEIIGRGSNQVERLRNPTAHAEILAIEQAVKVVNDWRLVGTTMYVTKEPCPMCAGAIVLARIDRVVWGLTDPLRGGAISVTKVFEQPGLNHHPAFLAGVLEDECRAVIQSFFKARRVDDA